MKRTACLIVALAGVQASLATPPPVVSTRVIERAANHEVIESVRVNPAGTVLVTNHYTRIGNGLNYQDTSGNWVPSEPMVQMFPGGVVCAGASYSAILGTNLNTAGAVDLLTCDQKRIVSRPIAIAFFDPVSGQRVILAKVKDCLPELISSNEIAYADAFDGNGIQATVVYEYAVGHFSQDVKFLAPLAVTPAAFGLGNRTRLEILTAIEQCPTPTITSHVLESETDAALRGTMAQPDLVDQMLDFGGMHMPLGHAYPPKTPAARLGPPQGVAVAKQLVTIDGQTVLVEAIPWAKVTNQLAKLPQQSAKTDRPNSPIALKLELAKDQTPRTATPSFPSRLAQITRSQPILLASTALKANGFVIDYSVVPSSGPYTFEAGETYLVNGMVDLSVVTFHQGAIIKYGTPFATLTIGGSVSTYYPPTGPAVIFTSLNDDSVGDPIPGSSGDPGSAAIAGWELQLEYLDVDPYFGPLDFRYAYGGIDVEASAGHSVTIESAGFLDFYEGIGAGEIDSLNVGSICICSPDWGAGWEYWLPGTVSIGTLFYCDDVDNNGFPQEYTGTTPDQISGLTVWLDASVAASFTKNGNQITRWADQTQNGYDAAQSNPDYAPIYVPNAINGNHAVVQFSSSGQYGQQLNLQNNCLTSLNTYGGEIFAVLKTNLFALGVNNFQTLWLLGNNGNRNNELYPFYDGSIREDFGNSQSSYELGVPAQPLGRYHIYEVAAAPNHDWAAWINGVLLHHESANPVGFTASPAIGSTYAGVPSGFYGFNGDIAEILIYSPVLSQADKITVNAYLNNKYGMVRATPDTPASVSAHAISQTQIGLTWSEILTNGGATRINIERRSPGGGYTVIAQVANALSYVDTGLTPGSTYYYRLRAVNTTNWSDYSSMVTVNTLSSGPDAPFGNLVVWLKADSGLAQIGTSGGPNTPVNLWVDQSGNNNHATQPAATSQPLWVPNAINGLPVVRFSSSTQSQWMSLPNCLSSLREGEVFAVLRVTGFPGRNNLQTLWIFGSNQNPSYEQYPFYDGSTYSINENFGNTGSGFRLYPAQYGLSIDQYHVYEVAANNSGWWAWINGQQLDHEPVNTVGFASSPSLGDNPPPGQGWYSFRGDIAEILIFNQVLSGDQNSGQKKVVLDYLKAKYGL